MREYIEIMCTSPSDVVIEISQKINEEFEFLSVIVKRPNAFLLRMKRKPSSGPPHDRDWVDLHPISSVVKNSTRLESINTGNNLREPAPTEPIWQLDSGAM